MTYLHFLLCASTAYSLHSPALYRLYTDVISARLPRSTRRRLGLHTRQQVLFHKLSHSLPSGTFLFLPRPHRNEQLWLQLRSHPQATTSIDLFHSGIVLLNPKLQKQHLLLR